MGNYARHTCAFQPYYVKVIEDLLEKHGVDVYLGGGIPNYERLNRIKDFKVYGSNKGQSVSNKYKPITPIYAISGIASKSFFDKKYLENFNKNISKLYNGYSDTSPSIINVKVNEEKIEFQQMYKTNDSKFKLGDFFTVSYIGTVNQNKLVRFIIYIT